MDINRVRIGQKVVVTVGNYSWREKCDYDYLTRVEGYNGRVLIVSEIDRNPKLLHGPGITLVDDQGIKSYFALADEIEPYKPEPPKQPKRIRSEYISNWDDEYPEYIYVGRGGGLGEYD